MNPLENLKAVLCDPEGKCCISGSPEDRAIVDAALAALAAQQVAEPVGKVTESIYNTPYVTIPLAEVQHVERRGHGQYMVVMKSTTYNNEFGDYNNAVCLSKEQGPPFLAAWCRYYGELESARPDAPASQQLAEPVATNDSFLCRAWGETDLPVAGVVQGWAEVRQFLIVEWLGKEDEEALDQFHTEFEKYEADQRGAYSTEFEIGGISVERVFGYPLTRPPQGGGV